MDKKINILFVHHYPGLGGATMSLFYIIERLNKNRFDTTVLFLGHEGKGIDFYKSKGIKVMTFDPVPIYPHAHGARLYFLSKRPWKPLTLFFEINKSANKIAGWFEKHQFDIVHLNTSLLLPFGKAASLSGAKVVWHIRENLLTGLLGIRKSIVKNWIHRYADRIITISKVEAEKISHPEKVKVVYNYIDFEKFNYQLSGETIRAEFNLGKSDFIVCNLGGLLHSKGGLVFAKAARLLVKKYPDIKFLLVGNDLSFKPLPFISAIKYHIKKFLGLKVGNGYPVYKIVKDNNLSEQFILTGLRLDVPQILAASNLLCWTATEPHFSRPIIEAAAMKVPAVATGFLNTKETMVPGVTGLTFKCNDEKRMAEQIEALYLNREKSRQMGEKAFTHASKKFNAAHNFQLIENEYYQLLSIKNYDRSAN